MLPKVYDTYGAKVSSPKSCQKLNKSSKSNVDCTLAGCLGEGFESVVGSTVLAVCCNWLHASSHFTLVKRRRGERERERERESEAILLPLPEINVPPNIVCFLLPEEREEEGELDR